MCTGYKGDGGSEDGWMDGWMEEWSVEWCGMVVVHVICTLTSNENILAEWSVAIVQGMFARE